MSSFLRTEESLSGKFDSREVWPRTQMLLLRISDSRLYGVAYYLNLPSLVRFTNCELQISSQSSYIVSPI